MHPLHRRKNKLYLWFRQFGHAKNLAIALTIAAIISVLITYFAITQSSSPFGADPKAILALIIIDLVFLLGLAGIISKRLAKLIVERRKGLVGSRLQMRIVVIFSLVAIIPTVIMAVFSLLFFNYGIQSWFDKKVNTAIKGSVAIAELYLEEHKKIIRADIMGMANDLNREAYNLRKNPYSFNSKVALLASIRKLPEAIVFQRQENRHITLARTQFSYALQLFLEELSPEIIERAEAGELVILTNETDDRVIALIRLESFFETYLLVGRFVDNTIIQHIELTKGAANQYNKLKADISNLQIKFFIIFIIVALLLLLATVWLGLIFALDMVKPVAGLISATQKVKKGDFSIRVKEGPMNDEIATLGRAFNRMTLQLEKQRKELITIQRAAAWSDVARRIAHEIKNPLTPINLAAERLRKKYAHYSGEPETFEKYINTIIKNVDNIGKMAEEFSSFARMPAPIFERYNLNRLIGDIIFSQQEVHSAISYQFHHPENAIILLCDPGQISQALINLLKNAEESISDKMTENHSFTAGIITITLLEKEESCILTITDNGKGFNKTIIEHLTEPYVTTKSKGTGLGLAIVKKIIEEHKATITFTNHDNEGATVEITFPYLAAETAS